MPRRTSILAAAVIAAAFLVTLPATAQPAAQAAPAAPPALTAAVQAAPTPAPAAMPAAAWLQPEPQRSVAPVLPGDAQSPLAPFQASTCLQQCIKNGGEGQCCAYMCHPIGENPC